MHIYNSIPNDSNFIYEAIWRRDLKRLKLNTKNELINLLSKKKNL